jgi:hypothetical protein
VLLNMLNSEVERLRLTEKLQLEGIERVDRDNKRQSILLSLTQNQIQLVKDANVKLQEQLMEKEAQLQTANTLSAELQEDLRRAHDNVRALQISSSSKLDDLTREALVTAKSLEEAKAAQLAAAEEVKRLAEQLQASRSEQEKASRLAFEHRVHLETRLQQKTAELQHTEELRTKEGREVLAREYQLSKSLSEAKRELRDVQGMYEADKRKHFELCATLKADSETLQLRVARMEKEHREREQDLVVQVERLKLDLRMTQELQEEQRTSAQARERALETQQQKLVTDLRSAQSEVNTLVDKEVVHHRERVETVVSLNARNDAQKQHIARLEDELQAAKDRLRIAVVESAADREALRAQHGAQSEGLAAKLEAKTRELLAMSAENFQAQSRNAALEQELSTLKQKAQRTADAQSTEIASHRAEIDGYKKAVAKLEQHIEESYEVKLLTEQNAQLQEEVALLKQRLVNANSAFANLRIEADISDNYRASLLQERVEQQLKRAAALEAERAAIRPLMDTLLDVVQAKGYSDPALDRDIDSYVRQYGRQPSKLLKPSNR